MSGKTLILVIDGFALDYITKENTPNLFRLGQAGFYKKILSAIPSVTNVNHASILSGSFPANHGVVGNYYYERESGEEGFIEASRHMKVPTILDIYKKQGKSTALLTVKGKVLEVFGDDVDLGINLQKPDPAILTKFNLETPPDVGSLETSAWILKACYHVLNTENPDLVYCTTNDYMMHNHTPDSAEAIEVMQAIDYWVGRIYDLDPDREIYITADHGMGQKNRLIDLQKKLDAAGFRTFCLLPIKDRYLENHIYQEGGAMYVHVLEESQIPEVLAYLKASDFLDAVYEKEAAADAFHLPVDGIGDIFVLCTKETAFGELEQDELFVNTRTHGSLHEREIPLFAVNAKKDEAFYSYSIDIVRGMLENG